ncbi:hypothetical protein IPL68_06030 [Candidatus Saccharibacteria bacterium]|nr:MAG: hypothetical protein IPL68_06030 [Candidatus Saccharibacteria bacterium]
MKFTNSLKKAGVLKVGSVKATYTSATDRPIEFQNDDMTGFTSPPQTPHEPKQTTTPSTQAATVVSKKYFTASAICTVLFCLLALTSKIGWLIALIWVVFSYVVWRWYKIKRPAVGLPLVPLLIGLVVISLFIVLITQTETTTKETTQTTSSSTKSSGNNPNAGSTAVTSSKSYKEVHDCTFPAKQSPTVPAGYNAKLISSAYRDVAVGEVRPDSNKSSFRLADFTATSKPAETVYFIVAGASDQTIPGVEMYLEVCNTTSNKSTAISTIADYNSSPTSDNTRGVEMSMSFVNAPDKTGSYRVDGLMKVAGGTWQLAARKPVEFK